MLHVDLKNKTRKSHQVKTSLDKSNAPPGNRTRVARMGILHDTTTPAAHVPYIKVKYCLKKPKPGVVSHRLYTSHIVFGLGTSVFFVILDKVADRTPMVIVRWSGLSCSIGEVTGGKKKSDVSTDHPLRPSSSIHRLSIVRCLFVDRLVSLASGVMSW